MRELTYATMTPAERRLGELICDAKLSAAENEIAELRARLQEFRAAGDKNDHPEITDRVHDLDAAPTDLLGATMDREGYCQGRAASVI